jgi:hypothetical protein
VHLAGFAAAETGGGAVADLGTGSRSARIAAAGAATRGTALGIVREATGGVEGLLAGTEGEAGGTVTANEYAIDI